MVPLTVEPNVGDRFVNAMMEVPASYTMLQRQDKKFPRTREVQNLGQGWQTQGVIMRLPFSKISRRRAERRQTGMCMGKWRFWRAS
jgi:hypothetical protein